MRDNKMVDGEQSGVERSLTVAIRRATDEDELLRLAKQVEGLLETAKQSKDHALADCVGRLLGELRSASGTGPKTRRVVLEYKDCAVALTSSRYEVKRTSAKRAAMEVAGYASTFNGEPDAYGDIILPGAYRKSLQRHRDAGTLPRLFWSHRPDQVPGRWDDMREDAHGLVADGRLAPTSLGTDLDVLIDMGAVDALSIGFVIPEGGARYESSGVRVIKEIDLHEVSIVSLPANPNARLHASSAPSFDPVDKLSNLLREAAALAASAERESSNVITFPTHKADAIDDAAVDQLRALADRIGKYTRTRH